MQRMVLAGLFLMQALPAQAQDEVCGHFYSDESFVGNWEMTTGSGITTDSAKSAIIPMTNEATGPVTIVKQGRALTLETEFIDMAMAVGEIDYHTDAQEYSRLAPENSALEDEDISLVLGCDWKHLQPLMARAEGQTPFGEMAVWQINAVVVAQDAGGNPSGLFGTFRVLGVGLDVQSERTVLLTR